MSILGIIIIVAYALLGIARYAAAKYIIDFYDEVDNQPDYIKKKLTKTYAYWFGTFTVNFNTVSDDDGFFAFVYGIFVVLAWPIGLSVWIFALIVNIIARLFGFNWDGDDFVSYSVDKTIQNAWREHLIEERAAELRDEELGEFDTKKIRISDYFEKAEMQLKEEGKI